MSSDTEPEDAEVLDTLSSKAQALEKLMRSMP